MRFLLLIISKIKQIYEGLNPVRILAGFIIFILILLLVKSAHSAVPFDGKKISIIANALSDNKKLYMPIDFYVEVVVFQIKDNTKMSIPSAKSDRFYEEMFLLNYSFSDINIEFVVGKIVPIKIIINFDSEEEFEKKWKEEFIKIISSETLCMHEEIANSKKNRCSVFLKFFLGPGVQGLSKMPYWENSKGIRFLGLMKDKYVMAHEFGHYFGLMHTFNEFGDFVADTPDGPDSVFKLGTDLDPNCNNIMTYSQKDDQEEKIFTKGQIDYMKKFATSFRYSELYEQMPDGCYGYENISLMIENMVKSIK
jgi:hypothetical protein